MTPTDFKYRARFPTLTDEQVQDAIDAVETQWSGALLFWASLPTIIRDAKRLLLENYLVAWYLTGLYPLAVKGVANNGGLPLSSKSIGGVSVSFADLDAQEGLKMLVTNVFGATALSMIQSAPERFKIYGA
jgi:hypothetical protein